MPKVFSFTSNDDLDHMAGAIPRRGAVTALVGAMGAAALAGCTSSRDTSQATATEQQALSGTDVKWVDTVLGAHPPAARTGDLATKTAATLGATIVFAKGCVTPGDGGGGMFFWDPGLGTDNGGTVIVPNAGVGSTGSCWRRVNR